MSVATDEALEQHGLHSDEIGGEGSWYSAAELDDAYVAGRTADPTEAEIEAVARVFFGNLHYPSASLDWDKASDYVKDNWRLRARIALNAARKAVME